MSETDWRGQVTYILIPPLIMSKTFLIWSTPPLPFFRGFLEFYSKFTSRARVSRGQKLYRHIDIQLEIFQFSKILSPNLTPLRYFLICYFFCGVGISSVKGQNNMRNGFGAFETPQQVKIFSKTYWNPK